MELVYVAIVSSVTGLIGLLLYQRFSILNWSMKMDYKEQQYKHKEKIEKMRTKKSLDRLKLKQSKKKVDLGNIDLDKIGDIVEGVTDLNEGAGEGGIMDIVNYFLKGAGNKKEPSVDMEEGEDYNIKEGY